MLTTEYSRDYFLTAGETDAQGRMPMWLIFNRVIEVATEHANAIGVGYADLMPLGIGWVLARVSVEMYRYPAINEPYKFTTWIEGYNRMFSDRCMEITAADGEVVGGIRTVWMAIDMAKRGAADLSCLDTSRFVISTDRKSPVAKQGKIPLLPPEAKVADYTFKYCDIDFNRHVNTVQYVRHILNQWPMERFDAEMIGRFDIAFHAECRYGSTVKIRSCDLSPSSSVCDIVNPEGHRAVAAAIKWLPRP